jgi:hypothetical protein
MNIIEPLKNRGLYVRTLLYSNLFTYGLKINTTVPRKDYVNDAPKPNNEVGKTWDNVEECIFSKSFVCDID